MPADGNGCFVLCLTKVLLFVVIVLFVLYLPLGDPQAICEEKSKPKGGIVCMCQIYQVVFTLAENAVYALDVLCSTTINALYEGKLQIYSLLSKIDRKDYCQAGCCCDGVCCNDEDGDTQLRDKPTPSRYNGNGKSSRR